jgi:UDP-glucose 4-epimerase
MTMENRKKILVTGGAGYIGSHVVHELCDAGYSVVILDNLSLGHRENLAKGVDFIEGDIRNTTNLNEAFNQGIEIVFHFAAWKAAGESMTVPEKYAQNNICGTISLLNAMLEHNVRYFIFSSSAAVYGNPEYLPIDEKHVLHPSNYYGYTKMAIEQNLEWYSALKGIKYAALRYFNATGYDIKGRVKAKEKNPANLSPVVMETCAGNRDKMQVYGHDYDTPDGSCIRDYIHVNDLASAHLMAMDYLQKNNDNLVVNLGTGKGYSVFEVIKAAQEVTGRPVPYEVVGRREGDPQELIASSQRAFKKLGWKTYYSDLETIFKTMAMVYL